MTLRVTTPSRLHFGLLGWGKEAPRQFGSVGLMVNDPGLIIEAQKADRWSAAGQLANRVLSVAERVVRSLHAEAIVPSPLRFEVQSSPPEHVGLGTGTQLSLAVARLILASLGIENPEVDRLVALTGRGRRSGIGVHGFMGGGLIVDAGHSARSTIPPLLARMTFPAEWKLLLVVPSNGLRMSGTRESEAFARLPDPPSRATDRLCRLVLLELLPAVAERNLVGFGEALGRIQGEVGTCFAPVQGGKFAGPDLEQVAQSMSELGLVGIGQSSWGPTLYGFINADPNERDRIIDALRPRLPTPTDLLIWTESSSRGAIMNAIDSGG